MITNKNLLLNKIKDFCKYYTSECFIISHSINDYDASVDFTFTLNKKVDGFLHLNLLSEFSIPYVPDFVINKIQVDKLSCNSLQSSTNLRNLPRIFCGKFFSISNAIFLYDIFNFPVFENNNTKCEIFINSCYRLDSLIPIQRDYLGALYLCDIGIKNLHSLPPLLKALVIKNCRGFVDVKNFERFENVESFHMYTDMGRSDVNITNVLDIFNNKSLKRFACSFTSNLAIIRKEAHILSLLEHYINTYGLSRIDYIMDFVLEAHDLNLELL